VKSEDDGKRYFVFIRLSENEDRIKDFALTSAKNEDDIIYAGLEYISGEVDFGKSSDDDDEKT